MSNTLFGALVVFAASITGILWIIRVRRTLTELAERRRDREERRAERKERRLARKCQAKKQGLISTRSIGGEYDDVPF